MNVWPIHVVFMLTVPIQLGHFRVLAEQALLEMDSFAQVSRYYGFLNDLMWCCNCM